VPDPGGCRHGDIIVARALQRLPSDRIAPIIHPVDRGGLRFGRKHDREIFIAWRRRRHAAIRGERLELIADDAIADRGGLRLRALLAIDPRRPADAEQPRMMLEKSSAEDFELAARDLV